MIKGTYSVSLLFQAFDATTNKELNYFEHRIILEHLLEDVSKKDFINYIYRECLEEPYETADNSFIFWKVVKILDVFEIMDIIPMSVVNHAELYSRSLSYDHLTRNEILDRFFSDFIWEDNN